MNSKPLDLVEFLMLLIDGLQSAGIEYMIGGAIAGWAWGEPRATQDLDLVVNIPMDSVVALANELKKRDMPVPPEIILDALLENRTDLPVNVIHMYSGLKADLFPVRAEDELRQLAFRRRQAVDFGEPIGKVYVHSPEDLIIYKLIYFSISEQPKHVRDITAILRAQKNLLDLVYIENWVYRLGLMTLWNELFDNAGWE
jgi:hypothetical protein